MRSTFTKATYHMYFKLLFIFAVLLCAYHPAKAQKFDINTIHCSLSADNTATLNKIGKFEGHFFNVIFNTEANDTLTIKINLYGRHGEYKDMQKTAMNTTFIDGFYSNVTNEIYMYKTDNFMNILLHEISHAILRNNLKNPPKWLNEGIATVFGRMVISHDEVFYVKQTHYIKFVKDAIQSGNFSLSGFFHYQNSDWLIADKREMLYSVSYCLICYFVQNNINDLQRFMLLLQQGDSVSTAMNKIFGSFNNFENKFHEFMGHESAYSVE